MPPTISVHCMRPTPADAIVAPASVQRTIEEPFRVLLRRSRPARREHDRRRRRHQRAEVNGGSERHEIRRQQHPALVACGRPLARERGRRRASRPRAAPPPRTPRSPSHWTTPTSIVPAASAASTSDPSPVARADASRHEPRRARAGERGARGRQEVRRAREPDRAAERAGPHVRERDVQRRARRMRDAERRALAAISSPASQNVTPGASVAT